LIALWEFLRCRDVDLYVIEIAGKGSPYQFEGVSEKSINMEWWIQLYPYSKIGDQDLHSLIETILNHLKKISPDVVFAGAIAFPSGAAALRWKTIYKKPIVIFDDARLDDVPRPFYVNWIKRQLYSLADAALIPAPSHDSTYRYFGLESQQLFYGINCVDNSFFYSNLRSLYHKPLNHKQPYLLGVGRQIPQKNWKSLLFVYENIIRVYKEFNIDLILIGDGSEHLSLKQSIQCDLKDRVFLLPYKSQNELAVYYANAEALILPSIKETWGLVVNEAMASGLPVLVSNGCGCSETLVQEGINGFTFDPNNTNSISRAIISFFQLSRSKRRDMGYASQAIIANWDLDRFCDGVWDALIYISLNIRSSGTLYGRLISRHWKGRYNPT